MGFWKKLGIWNMFTGKTPEARAIGAIVALDEHEKEQDAKHNQHSSISLKNTTYHRNKWMIKSPNTSLPDNNKTTQ